MITQSSGERAQVCLISPPFQYAQGPSLALGLLKAALLEDGISCHVDYADMYMLHILGIDNHLLFNSGSMVEYLGEYVFCRAAGITPEYDLEKLAALCAEKGKTMGIPELEAFLTQAQQIAEEQVERTVQRVLAYGPGIVGVTSCFQQRNAAIAICRRIKQLRPEVVTLMGGANCFGRAGIGILREFPWVDYVFFGESDDIFAPVCRSILEGTEAPLPYGVLKQGDPLPEVPPHRIVTNLDALPYPNFDEYFEMLTKEEGRYLLSVSSQGRGVFQELTLYLEASRGCWWGEKTPCTFCGLHGAIRQYRSKSPQRVLDEVLALTEKYGLRNVIFTDCIMPRQWLDRFVPLLREHPAGLTLFHELRSHHSAHEIEALSQVGYKYLQPGIESLSDHSLKLMHKGVTMLQNLNFLKFSRRYGIRLSWNLLYGFPGERKEDYREQSALIPLIHHFQAPLSCGAIIYARYNEYADHPEKYGLSLKPSESYAYYCPQKQDYIDDIAAYYDLQTPVGKPPKEEEDLLCDAVKEWLQRHQITRLDVADLGDKLLIIDTRRCRDLRAQYLVGAERDVYRLCASPVWVATVQRQLSGQYAPAAVEGAIRSLVSKKLLLQHGKSVFALALPYSFQELKQREVWEFQLACQQNAALRQQVEEATHSCTSDASRQSVITQFARKLGMCFTGQDYERYAYGKENNL